MKFSYSRVECFKKCPYQFKLRYIDELQTLDEYEPSDSLKVGTALHTGIEIGVKEAIKEYYMSYPVINDSHVNESIKLETMIKKAREVLPLRDAQFEVLLEDENFKGYIDMLVPSELSLELRDDICFNCLKTDCPYESSGRCPYGKYDNTYDIYDFKYSNNISHYMESAQLSIYKYYAEKLLGIKINHLYFVFVGKTMIRQKKTEDLSKFRLRLKEVIKDLEVQIKEVSYNADKVIEFIQNEVNILQCSDYIKQPSRLCDWCEYQEYCEKKEELDMLPSNKRVEVEVNSFKKFWIYGPSFSGKTTFADESDTPLNLNTDGNVKYVTMPRLSIKDEVTVEGRLTKRKFAWSVFKEAIDDLEKGSEFKTIVVDLLEDTYEACRLYMYDQLGISHESDDSFRAWDKVRIEFLSTFKRLMNLPYNVILISHEDTSTDITKKGGDKITAIKPNLNDKASKKIAGMVDLVARLVVDGDKRTLEFKSDEVVFGGGRLQGVKTTEIPLSWDALCEVYDEAIGKVKEKTAHQKKVESFVKDQEPTPEVTITKEEAEELPFDTSDMKVVDEPVEEEVKPTRRTRRVRNG